jgi:membrane anchored protein
MPTATAAESKALFNGDGSARALDLSMPLLNSPLLGSLPALGSSVGSLPVVGGAAGNGGLPVVGDLLKGITIGLTSTLFNSDPKAQGAAIGSCSLLSSTVKLPLPVDLPCLSESSQTSSAPGDVAAQGTGTEKCASNLSVGIVELITSCGQSNSYIEANRPVSLNKAGVATLNIGLTNLGGLLGLNAADSTNKLVDSVTSLLSGILGTVQGIAPVAPLDLKGAVQQVLDQLKGASLAKLATIQAGFSTTNVSNESGSITNVVSSAAGSQIGLLGLTNALTDGLVVVDVSAARALATWNDVTGTASSSSTPAVATIKVKDLLNLVPGDYLTSTVDAGLLNGLLAPLSGTILDSGIELASATPPQQGNNVVASTSGVALRLLRGLGESAVGARDGGLSLRLAAADVRLAGDIVKAAVVQPALPTTGGATYLFLAAAAILATGAGVVGRKGRKLRKAA